MRYAALAAALLAAGCAPRTASAPTESPDTLAGRREIWAAVEPLAATRDIDPQFVYALVKLESNFNAHAQRGEARGLMQLKPRAWRVVSDLPYGTAVWDWRTNLRVGMDLLASDKRTLTRKGVFSYPLLWACFHYGSDFVAAHGYDMSRIPRPSDAVSFKLWSGDVHPVAPPG